MKAPAIDLVDDQAIADVLHVSRRVVGNLTRAKKIPCLRISRKKIMYVLEDVIQAIRDRSEDE